MESAEFAAMVARLERESAVSPGRYQLKVAALTALGFAILAMILFVAGFGIALLAGIAIAVIASGGKFAVLLLKFGKFLILLAIPLWLLVKSAVSALFIRFTPPQGREIRRQDAPQLFAAMDGLRSRMHGPRFHHVLLTDDMNAAVVQQPAFGLFGFPRNYLILGLPLLESLSAKEALAVVAHEYGHLAGSHARFGAFIYRLRHTWSTIQGISQQWNGFAGRGLRRLVEWYAPYFNAYTFVLARANEYQADAASAELVSPDVAASALKRVNIAAAQYERFMERVFDGVREASQPPADVADRWAHDAAAMPPQAIATKWLEESLGREKHAFDTHPVLRERLLALGGDEQAAAALPPARQGESAAAAWLGERAGAMRGEAQRNWQESVSQHWSSRHETVQAQRARLAELESLAERDTAQQVERLRLRVAVDPHGSHVAELTEFNRTTPDQAVTLFLEGSLRIDLGDASGIALLERAMQLDGEAIKPGAQKAFEFLKRRKQDAEAERFAERWRERDRWEAQREHEYQHLDSRHELVAPDLDAATLQQIRTLLEANRDGIAKVWLARRILPSDPSLRSYVIGIELGGWAKFRSKGPEILQRLAALEWPIAAFFCTFDADNAALGKKLRAIEGARIDFDEPTR